MSGAESEIPSEFDTLDSAKATVIQFYNHKVDSASTTSV